MATKKNLHAAAVALGREGGNAAKRKKVGIHDPAYKAKRKKATKTAPKKAAAKTKPAARKKAAPKRKAAAPKKVVRKKAAAPKKKAAKRKAAPKKAKQMKLF